MYKTNGKTIICGNTKYPLYLMQQLFNTGEEGVLTIRKRVFPKQKDFILITDEQELIKTCSNSFSGITVINAEASDDEVLIEQGIENADAIVISYGDDRENLLITLSTRQLNPSIKIIVTCSMIETMRPKLLRAGADSVISPSTISGNKMAAQLVRPSTTAFLEEFLHSENNNFSAQEIYISKADQNLGLTIINSEYARASLLILAISRDDTDEILYNPPSSYKLQKGDVLLVLGTIPNFQKLSPYTQYHLKDLEIDDPKYSTN